MARTDGSSCLDATPGPRRSSADAAGRLGMERSHPAGRGEHTPSRRAISAAMAKTDGARCATPASSEERHIMRFCREKQHTHSADWSILGRVLCCGCCRRERFGRIGQAGLGEQINRNDNCLRHQRCATARCRVAKNIQSCLLQQIRESERRVLVSQFCAILWSALRRLGLPVQCILLCTRLRNTLCQAPIQILNLCASCFKDKDIQLPAQNPHTAHSEPLHPGPNGHTKPNRTRSIFRNQPNMRCSVCPGRVQALTDGKKVH
jgi:hypothetical protein